MECKLHGYKQHNSSVTREGCRKLLIELKAKHIDRTITRLRGPDGFKVSFTEIKDCHAAIEKDFKDGAKGPADTCAEMLLEFHKVSKLKQ